VTAASAAWFSRLGAALAPDEERAIAALLASHPLLAEAGFATVAHWREAAGIVRAGDWDSAWWDREEEERERLWQQASERIGEAALFQRVAACGDALTTSVHAGAAAAAARGEWNDADFLRAASGAALLAAQQAMLAELAGEAAAHWFTHKRVLFAVGRWPLGLVQGRYFVF
jgi:hypothetical protein